MGRTGRLIGALGSGILSGATGAVSLGVNAVYTGVSAGSSVVSGVVSYLPLPRRSAPVDELSQQPGGDEDKDEPSPPLPGAKSGILSRILPRGSTKDKVE